MFQDEIWFLRMCHYVSRRNLVSAHVPSCFERCLAPFKVVTVTNYITDFGRNQTPSEARVHQLLVALGLISHQVTKFPLRQ